MGGRAHKVHTDPITIIAVALCILASSAAGVGINSGHPGGAPGDASGLTGSGPAQDGAASTAVLSDEDMPGCTGEHLCVGAAKAVVTPAQRHIDGVMEERSFVAPKVQKFNLGGFGVAPLQNFPDPLGEVDQALNAPAAATHFEGSRGREDTWIRAFVVRDQQGETVAFVALDAVGAGNIIQERLKAAVSAATRIPPDNILFGQTHTHAGADLQGLWGGVPQDWIETILYPQAAAAVAEALRSSRPATLEVRSGDAHEFNNYRRPKRIDPAVDTDGLTSLLQAKDAETGDVLGSLLQFNAHPTSINESPRVPHPDYVLGAVDWIEEHSGGVAVYYNGPIAEASGAGRRAGCAYPQDARYGDVRCRGEGIAAAALSFEVDRVLEPALDVRHETVYLPVTNPLFVAAGAIGSFNRYYDFLQLPAEQIPVVGEYVAAGVADLPQLTPTASTLVSRVTIGGAGSGLEIVTIPGEATGTFGDFIRDLAEPGAHMMFLGLTQNSFGYIIPEEEFSYFDASGGSGFLAPFTGYEEFVSLGPLTAPLLRALGYVPLFDAEGSERLPPTLLACSVDPFSDDCILHATGRHLDYIQSQFARNCRDIGGPDEFCSLLNPDLPLARACQNAGLPTGVCDVLRSRPGAGTGGDGRSRAGVAVVDMTPDVGYCSGQYCDVSDMPESLAGGEIDPHLTHTIKKRSHGVQSRLTARALVVEGANGKRVALVKTDNYLPQDLLIRRVAQILEEGNSGISHDQILHHVTHNHSSSYSSTWAWGVAIFQDAFDPRFFEHQARRIAESIELAAAGLVPVRMGATTLRHTTFKGNVVGLSAANDGTPAGYPLEHGDHDLTVMRFDDVSDEASPVPLAAWVNWGLHPEGLDGYDLHSADFLAPLERFVEQDIGAPLVFSQGDVGSAERSGNRCHVLDEEGRLVRDATETVGGNGHPNCGPIEPDEGVIRDWDHRGYVQNERNVRYLADDIVRGFERIAEITTDDPSTGSIAFSDDFDVDHLSVWTPGPLSHSYPGVSNCLVEPTAAGDTGIPVAGLPDCERTGMPGANPLSEQLAFALSELKEQGLPVPDHYGVTGFSGVQENLRLYLQAFRIGDALLASCACESQADLIINLKTRANAITGDLYNGFDWACVAEDQGMLPRDERYSAQCDRQREIFDTSEFPTPVPGSLADPGKVARMRAQIHNDARGWDEPQNVLAANSEPADVEEIWGNFTHEEIQDLGVDGYTLVVGIGHAGDYNGYTVSYREYMNRDHYRKALQTYGPHTADYMVTRLVRMAAQLKGVGPSPMEPLVATALGDEIRQESMALAVGRATQTAYDAWLSALPADASPESRQQPTDTTRFDAAHFAWRGGNPQVDNPVVRVERLVDGSWRPFAGPAGEVPVKVHWPHGVPGAVESYAGQHDWTWTAAFEAYTAFPARLGGTPLGTYRFVAEGCANDGADDPLVGAQRRIQGLISAVSREAATLIDVLTGDGCPGLSRPYEIASDSFDVLPWDIPITDVEREPGSISFRVPAIDYPQTYAGQFVYLDDTVTRQICERCTFRPWAQRGVFDRAEVITPQRAVPATCTAHPDGGYACSARGVPPVQAEIVVYDRDGNRGSAPV